MACRKAERTKLPLAPGGLLSAMRRTRAATFSLSCGCVKLSLPHCTCTTPAFSVLKGHLPLPGGRHRLGHVGRHRAELRVGHQPAWPEDARHPPHQRHAVRRGDGAVEGEVPGCDALHEVLGADDVRAGVRGLLRLVAAGEDGNADALTRAVREATGAADALIGLARVEVEVEDQLHGRHGRGRPARTQEAQGELHGEH